MTVFVSLFRGINVGGHHKVKMADLKELHESLGFKDVFLYIQSGNVVFTSDEADPARIQKHIEESFEQKFGFYVEVFVRTSAELEAIIEKNPFQGQQNIESKWVVVLFLAAYADDAAQEALQQAYSGPEQIFVIGKEVYIYYSDSIGHSKLSNSLLEKKLKTSGTARNWNTILQLRKLIQPRII